MSPSNKDHTLPSRDSDLSSLFGDETPPPETPPPETSAGTLVATSQTAPVLVDTQYKPISSSLALPPRCRFGYGTPEPKETATGTLPAAPQAAASPVDIHLQPANTEARPQTPRRTSEEQPKPKKAKTNDTYYRCRFHVAGMDCMQSSKDGLKNAAGLRNHMQSVHNLFDRRSKTWPECDFCQKQFNDPKKLKSHHDASYKTGNLCWGDDGGKHRRYWASPPQTQQDMADTWAFGRDGEVSAEYRIGSDGSNEGSAEVPARGVRRQRPGDAHRNDEDDAEAAAWPAKRRKREPMVAAPSANAGPVYQGIGLFGTTPNTTARFRPVPTNPNLVRGMPIDLTEDADNVPRAVNLLQYGRIPRGITQDNPIRL